MGHRHEGSARLDVKAASEFTRHYPCACAAEVYPLQPVRISPVFAVLARSFTNPSYLYLAVGAAAVGAYLYLSRDQGSNQPHLPLVQKIASTKPPGHW